MGDGSDRRLGNGLVGRFFCPSGAMVAHPICNREVSGFESPLGLVKAKQAVSLRNLGERKTLCYTNNWHDMERWVSG